MSVANLSVRRPVLMTVMALVIILLGAFGASNLGVREYPNVDYPLIQVRTSYPGANAAVVEAEVTEILEASINSASGIKALTSTSRDGFSFINIEFETGMDLEAAANEIRDRVSRVRRRLPDDVDEPTVYKSDSDNDPILMVSLVSDKLDPMEVSEIANNFVKERLQTINGVSEVAIWGEKRPTVRLWIDPVRLQALGVSGAEMSAALKRGNLELPSGSIEGSETTLSIRTLGRILDPKAFENIAVKTAADGTVIRISDVADIHYEPKDTRTGFRRNDIRREIPEGVQVLYGRDTSINIRASIKEVVETIFIAFLLVIAIIFAFLRQARTTLIPMVVVPVAVIGSFFVLYLCGFSINVLTLLAMVLAIGLVVDDAIVIVENIYHKIERGMTPKQAAVAGTNEIFFAVIATSVVLMAVFVPVLALGGTTGLLFREFVAVMIGTVFLSTLCALTLSPMLCSKFLSRQKQGWFFRVTEPFFDGLNRIYAVLLGGFLKLRFLLFPVVAGLLAIAYFCFNNMSSEMAPTEDSNAVMVNLNMPEGVTLTRTKRMADAFAEEVIALMDSNEYTEIQAGAWNAGNSRMRIFLNDDKKARRPQSEIARSIQVLGNEYPDLRVMVFEPQSISTQRGGLPVQFVLQAPNIEILRTLVPKFEEEASKSPVFSVVNTNLRFTKPELHIEILRDKANEEGVSVNDIAQAVQLAISDQSYGEFYKDGRQYDIIGAVGYQYRSMPENIAMLTVKNAKGELVSLDNFITFSERSASPSLPRFNRFSAATIQAGLVPGKTIGDGVEEMRRIAKHLLKDYPSVSTALSGSSKEFEESSSGLYIVFLLALALVFLVLAGQFESFRAPFVIFFTVPLALAGALACLFITGQTLNIFSEIALILLIALVTKNGILIVEFANQIAANTGCSKLEAARMAAERRFRPILMTSLSTVLGAVPLIMTGTPSRIAMGIAIAGGLTFATFLSLFVVPAAYSFFAGKVDATNTTDASKMA